MCAYSIIKYSGISIHALREEGDRENGKRQHSA